MFRRSPIAIAFVSILFFAPTAHAQQVTGSVRGTVRDATGVVAGAAVELRQNATGMVRRAATNDAGEYILAAVPPGEYTLSVRVTGYKRAERADVRVVTQDLLTADVTLEVGDVEASATVRATSPDSTVSTPRSVVLDRGLLSALPAPGRNAFLAGTIAPGFVSVGDPQFNRQQDQTNASRVSLGGGGVRANNYLLDGLSITDLSGRPVLMPTIEAIEDLKIDMRAYDAEAGRSGGGAFHAAARSGTNQPYASGFYQTRPIWGQALNYFHDQAGLTKEQTGMTGTYYRLWGGSAGGPIVKNRTFVWTAVEGYRSGTTRNLQRLWPGVNQRVGDFSRSTVRGVPVRIFNPWCRAGVNAKCPASGTGSMATGGEFTSAIIPRAHPAASTVGFNLLAAWPTTTNQGQPLQPNENNEPNAIAASVVVDRADMWTLKLDHKISDRWSVSGFYAYNRTDEPGALAMPASNAYMDSDYFLFGRRPQVLIVNSTRVLSGSSVLTVRYGWTTFPDQLAKTPTPDDLGTLGFNSSFLAAMHPDGRDTFPALLFDETTAVGFQGGTIRTWGGPISLNATLSSLRGRHALKAGVEARESRLTTGTELLMSGLYTFNRHFSGSEAVPASGHELASLLLGLPAGGFIPVNRGDGSWTSRYVATFLHDDWRVSPRVTISAGVRVEHEGGLREAQNRQTVAFDRDAVSPLDGLVHKSGTLLEGRTLRGGLIFAGVDGAPEAQGHLPAATIAPRLGVAVALGGQAMLHGGYGLFFAPPQYTSNGRGQTGFTQSTPVLQSAGDRDVPAVTLDNPFPSGLLAPAGSSAGLLTGVGGSVEFIDQNKGAPRVHQYSLDLQYDLRGGMTFLLGYSGASGRQLGFGGTNNVAININQVDPDVARQQAPGTSPGAWDVEALRAHVPNPFFGVPAAGALAAAPTIARAQLLRPFPQFADVNMREHTAGGRRQYHAMILAADKRVGASGWGGKFSYTWSRTMDSQFGEVNVYAPATAAPQNHYDLDAEYSRSHFDTPHRVVLAPLAHIPAPGGRAAAWLGGWTASAIVELVSGPPLNAVMSGSASELSLGLGGGQQRPNLNGDPNTPGDDADRVASAPHPAARWFNAAAFSSAGDGRYGTAPRTIAGARYQFRKNVDLVLMKDVPLQGRGTAQVRIEIINATNTPKFGGSGANAIDLASFGRVTDQLGFSRIVQLSVRYTY